MKLEATLVESMSVKFLLFGSANHRALLLRRVEIMLSRQSKILDYMNPSELINKSKPYVLAYLAEQDIPYRIVEFERRKLPVDGGFDPRRLNLTFRNNRLADYYHG